jgi:hypothetical protein
MQNAGNLVIENSTAVISLKPPGIVYVQIKTNAKQYLEDAKMNLDAAVRVCGNQKRPLLTDIREAQPLEPDARRYYSGQALVDHFSAMALLVDISPMGKMMANIYLKVAQPKIPSRIFTDLSSAEEWLAGFIQ